MRLGEIAIIDFDSPISKTKIIYSCNLFDENISTHLAFGCAYQNTIQNGVNMNNQESDNAECNICPEHMDFTIGTKDLQITVKTVNGETIEWFKNSTLIMA